MNKERFEIDCTGGILDLQDTKNMYCLNDSEICELLNKQARQIADLETKLAVSEKDRDVWKSMAKCGDKLTEKMRDEYQQLKQQLAEKEKENDELQDKLHSYYEEIMNKGTCGLCEYVRADYKISFAVEQLEKVKEYIESDKDWKVFAVIGLTKQFIDNQIKALKEGK